MQEIKAADADGRHEQLECRGCQADVIRRPRMFGSTGLIVALLTVRLGAACAAERHAALATTSVAAPANIAPGPTSVDPRSLAAGGYSTVVCAAVFLQGRDPAEAGRNSTYFVVADSDRDRVDRVEVDREKREVRASLGGGPLRTARFLEGAGCIALPEGGGLLKFAPDLAASALPPASGMPWPLGDAPIAPSLVSAVEREAMARAIDPWFEEAAALTSAVVVLHRGEIVAERYGQGATRDTLLDTSAVGKSVLATLAGVAAQQGALRLDEAAPIVEWSRAGDRRAAIRTIDLLRMSSGLACTIPFDDGWDKTRYSDSQYVYTGGIDAVAYALSRPAASGAGVVGHYANCDPLATTAILERAAAVRGETLLAWAQRSLYDRIGIRRMVTSRDAAGHPLFIGYHFATARDLARLALLYLRDGVSEGARLLPEGFVRTVTTPAPAWKDQDYGAGFWLAPDLWKGVPGDAIAMEGFGDQLVLIVPSLDLAVVRIGHPRGGRASGKLRPTVIDGIFAAARGR